jgi:hypothetical protein
MQRDSIISLRPAAAWRRALGAACADAQASYGCVDWYPYRNSSGPADPTGAAAVSAIAAASSSIIERAAAAAGATATGITRGASPTEAGAR